MSETARRVTVLLIEDHTMVRAALRTLLEQVETFEVVADTGDAREGIKLAKQWRPDVVLLDITMPGLSGIDAVSPLKKASPDSKVLIASQHEGEKFVRQALQAGADGYLSKESEPEELRLAIEAMARGESFVSSRVAGALVAGFIGEEGAPQGDESALRALTAREREVFQLVALGKANKEIARLLSVSLTTVKKHRENLQRKLDCHSAAELARLAIREGLLSA